MMEYRWIDDKSQDISKVLDLYREAFPENERIADEEFLKIDEYHELIAFYDHEFIGFAALVIYKDMINIIYFAIEKEKRSQGYGSQALAIIKNLKPDYRLCVDIEIAYEGVSNNAQRLARRKFYYLNDFKDTPVAYRWEGENYQILAYNGSINEQEFNEFWQVVLNRRDLWINMLSL